VIGKKYFFKLLVIASLWSIAGSTKLNFKKLSKLFWGSGEGNGRGYAVCCMFHTEPSMSMQCICVEHR